MEVEEPSTLDEASAIEVGDDVVGGTPDEPRSVDRNDDDKEMEEGGPTKGPPDDMVSGKKRSREIQDDGKEPNIGGSEVDAIETVETPADDVESVAGTGTLTAAAVATASITTDVAAAAAATPVPSSSSTAAAAAAAAVAAGNVSAASVAAAAQLSASMGWTGLSSLLSVSAHSSGGGGAIGSSSSSSAASAGALPTVEQVLQAATKYINESPPFCHLSKTDSAPQLKITNSECAVIAPVTDNGDGSTSSSASTAVATNVSASINDRLACKGGMRGYRMTRASHGVGPGSGNYYYEVVILEPPPVSEIVNSLPSNVRMGKKLQQELQLALLLEEEEKRKREEVAAAAASAASAATTAKDGTSDAGPTKENDQKETAASSQRNNGSNSHKPSFGAHVRLGWSMRTGDLQAPVGYDKWSYGLRDIGGSKIHCSKRDDHWGGEEFGPGDVVGCAISMVPGGGVSVPSGNDGKDVTGTTNSVPKATNGTTNSNDKLGQQGQQAVQAALHQPQGQYNHIRFFKNGVPMGEFIISKGKREGGAAFFIPDGVYYPAISLYMGASVKVNFGPNFIYQPRKLPTGMKVQPMSSLCKAPISVEDALTKVTKEKPFRKADMQQKFLELVRAEVQVLQDAYQNHRRKHVQDVILERKRRNLKTDDLESDDFYTK